jgi:allophanate hydrolase
MIRVGEGGIAIEVELWAVPLEGVGEFFASIPAPLSIGTIILDTGELVKGFLCEPFAVEGAIDISEYGGWLRYLERHSM